MKFFGRYIYDREKAREHQFCIFLSRTTEVVLGINALSFKSKWKQNIFLAYCIIDHVIYEAFEPFLMVGKQTSRLTSMSRTHLVFT